jgi:hypothetical protein
VVFRFLLLYLHIHLLVNRYFFFLISRHQHSTIRAQRRNRSNSQVQEPYSHYRILFNKFISFFNFIQNPFQGHPGPVFCRKFIIKRLPGFIINNKMLTPDKYFSSYSDNCFFLPALFAILIKISLILLSSLTATQLALIRAYLI